MPPGVNMGGREGRKLGWEGHALNHPPRPYSVAMTDPDRLLFSQSFNRYFTGHLQFAGAVQGPGHPEVMDTDKTPALMRFLHT